MGDQRCGSGRLSLMMKKATPYLLMIAMQFGSAGMYIITMSSFTKGMSRYVFIVYRNAMAALIFAPLALFLERKVRPKMTFPVFWRITLLGFLEVIVDQGFAFLGMVYTSASYTSAILNALPSITFLMAVILRMESVRIKEIRSQAKVMGTVLTLGGAVLMAVYKGPVLNVLGSSHHQSSSNESSGSSQRWIMGTLFLFISCVAFSAFYVLQSMVLKMYPAEMSVVSLLCFLGTMQAAGIAIAVEHNPRAWALGWDNRLFAPLYAGVVTTGIMFYVQGVVMRSRGPVFVTAFNPLRMIIVAILAIPILGDKLYLGSIIGSVIVAIGLYAVIWGKSKDGVNGNKSRCGETEGDHLHPQPQQLPVTMPPTQPKAQPTDAPPMPLHTAAQFQRGP